MKGIAINIYGVKPVFAYRVKGRDGQPYWLVTHGQQGQGRWRYRLPLHQQDFPCSEEGSAIMSLEGINVELAPIGRQDRLGNPLFVLRRTEHDDGDYLVFWCLSPPFHGHATYRIEGNAQEIARGQISNGGARLTAAPIVKVSGRCILTWSRSGCSPDDYAHWIAEYDGIDWQVKEDKQCKS